MGEKHDERGGAVGAGVFVEERGNRKRGKGLGKCAAMLFHHSLFHYFTQESINYEVRSTGRALLLAEGRCAEAEVVDVGLEPIPQPLPKGKGRTFS